MATLNRNTPRRGIFREYSTYAFRAKEQDPIIDTMKTLMADTVGLKRGAFQEVGGRTGLSPSTLSAWFTTHKTQMPRYASIVAFARGIGYDVALVKTQRQPSGRVWRANGPSILNGE